jgi:5-methylcytosine-specific restriction endonuclease McrA
MKAQSTAKRIDPEVWERIENWHHKGWSYTKLSKKYKISKGTLSYRFGKDQKEKTLKRMQKRRDSFQLKVDHFFDRIIDQKRNPIFINKRPERTWNCKVRSFYKNKLGSTKGLDLMTRREEMESHLWPNKGKDKNGLSFPYVTCAITGNKHSVMEAQSHPLGMNLDHIIPVARGGRNELENCQPLGTKINQMKGDMTNEEFFEQINKIIKGPWYQEMKKGGR